MARNLAKNRYRTVCHCLQGHSIQREPYKTFLKHLTPWRSRQKAWHSLNRPGWRWPHRPPPPWWAAASSPWTPASGWHRWWAFLPCNNTNNISKKMSDKFICETIFFQKRGSFEFKPFCHWILGTGNLTMLPPYGAHNRYQACTGTVNVICLMFPTNLQQMWDFIDIHIPYSCTGTYTEFYTSSYVLGFFYLLHLAIMAFWAMKTFSVGISMPMSPLYEHVS